MVTRDYWLNLLKTSAPLMLEGCLNSRPIMALSSYPKDTSFFAPGYFCSGAPLVCLFGSSSANVPLNQLNR
jgi:hypothetical protein